MRDRVGREEETERRRLTHLWHGFWHGSGRPQSCEKRASAQSESDHVNFILYLDRNLRSNRTTANSWPWSTLSTYGGQQR